MASRWPAILGVQLCVVLFACGRSDVFDLGQGDSSVGDALLKDAALDTGVPADTGPMFVDAGEHDTGVPVDTGVIIQDAGEQFPDAEPPDLGFIPDAEIEDAPSPDADFEDADTGIAADTGIPTDGGAPECMSDNDCGFNQHCDPQALTCVECFEDLHCGAQQVCDQTNGNVCRFPCFMGQCGPFGICEPNENVCVECLQDSDCDPGLVCNASTLECVECTSNADCALKPGRNLCDTTAGECAGCITDADCPAGEECAEQGGGVCVPPMGRGLCDPCTNDDQCGGPLDLCIGIVGGGGLFDRSCAIDCAGDPTVCPSGFACISVRNGEMQCRPSYDMQTPTCTATRRLTAACVLDPNDVDPGCGIDGVQDARCESTAAGGPGQCVVWCADNSDCASGTTCQPGTNGVDVCR